MAEVKASFRPEFINRIDEVIVFHALDEIQITGIARIQLQYLEQRLMRLDMRLEVEDSALAELSKAGFDPIFGARPLKRAIQEKLENPLAKAILEGQFAAKDIICDGSSATRPEIHPGRSGADRCVPEDPDRRAAQAAIADPAAFTKQYAKT
jgi:ATP-dependent Clp protease ATP-binding subunit ClpB